MLNCFFRCNINSLVVMSVLSLTCLNWWNQIVMISCQSWLCRWHPRENCPHKENTEATVIAIATDILYLFSKSVLYPHHRPWPMFQHDSRMIILGSCYICSSCNRNSWRLGSFKKRNSWSDCKTSMSDDHKVIEEISRDIWQGPTYLVYQRHNQTSLFLY